MLDVPESLSHISSGSRKMLVGGGGVVKEKESGCLGSDGETSDYQRSTPSPRDSNSRIPELIAEGLEKAEDEEDLGVVSGWEGVVRRGRSSQGREPTGSSSSSSSSTSSWAPASSPDLGFVDYPDHHNHHNHHSHLHQQQQQQHHSLVLSSIVEFRTSGQQSYHPQQSVASSGAEKNLPIFVSAKAASSTLTATSSSLKRSASGRTTAGQPTAADNCDGAQQCKKIRMSPGQDRLDLSGRRVNTRHSTAAASVPGRRGEAIAAGRASSKPSRFVSTNRQANRLAAKKCSRAGLELSLQKGVGGGRVKEISLPPATAAGLLNTFRISKPKSGVAGSKVLSSEGFVGCLEPKTFYRSTSCTDSSPRDRPTTTQTTAKNNDLLNTVSNIESAKKFKSSLKSSVSDCRIINGKSIKNSRNSDTSVLSNKFKEQEQQQRDDGRSRVSSTPEHSSDSSILISSDKNILQSKCGDGETAGISTLISEFSSTAQTQQHKRSHSVIINSSNGALESSHSVASTGESSNLTSSSSTSSPLLTATSTDIGVARPFRFPTVPGNHSAIPCKWAGCTEGFKTHGKLSDHIKTVHVTAQLGSEAAGEAGGAGEEESKEYSCLWEGCKVYGKKSSSRCWLEKHVPQHGGKFNFSCIVEGCKMRFSSQAMLQRHVNNHFSETSTSGTSTSGPRKSIEGVPARKVLKRAGVRLKFRKLPFSARIFDFFDAGMMAGIRDGVASLQAAGIRLGLAGGGEQIELSSKAVAIRKCPVSGQREVRLKWFPENMVPDEWVPLETATPSKTIKISALPEATKARLQHDLHLKPAPVAAGHNIATPPRRSRKTKRVEPPSVFLTPREVRGLSSEVKLEPVEFPHRAVSALFLT